MRAKPIDSTELQEAKNALQDAGLRATRVRVSLLALIKRKALPTFSAGQLAMVAEQAGVDSALASVYNNLEHFARVGLLQSIPSVQGTALYTLSDFVYIEEAELRDVPEALAQLANRIETEQPQRVQIIARMLPSALDD